MSHIENQTMQELNHLAQLLAKRNAIDEQIAHLIERPALTGHIGEFIASKVFQIRLNDNATQRGTDGYFTVGSLQGHSVNVKYYPKRENVLDIALHKPDYYLVLTGPRVPAGTSKGASRPHVIEGVFLFYASTLMEALMAKNLRIGIATSVRQEYWREAEIFPTQQNRLLVLSDDQRSWLSFFR